MKAYYCDSTEFVRETISAHIMERIPRLKLEQFESKHQLVGAIGRSLPDLIICTQSEGGLDVAQELSRQKRFPSSQFVLLTGTPDLDRQIAQSHCLKCTIIEKRKRDDIVDTIFKVMNIAEDQRVAC
jgi:hypothetical protein